jgi:hypothetical protein
MIGGKLASAAGSMFGLELEGMSAQDQEFEVARRVVRLSGEAVRHAVLMPPTGNPVVLAKDAVLAAAARHAPGLAGHAGGTAGGCKCGKGRHPGGGYGGGYGGRPRGPQGGGYRPRPRPGYGGYAGGGGTPQAGSGGYPQQGPGGGYGAPRPGGGRRGRRGLGQRGTWFLRGGAVVLVPGA